MPAVSSPPCNGKQAFPGELPPRRPRQGLRPRRARAFGGLCEATEGLAVVWLEVVAGVRGSATALMERLDALTDPERVEDAAMLTGWRAKYENEITERMKSGWWRRMGRKREVG